MRKKFGPLSLYWNYKYEGGYTYGAFLYFLGIGWSVMATRLDRT